MALRCGSLSRSLVSAARASWLGSSQPLPLLRPPTSDAPSILSRRISTESGDTASEGTRKKVNKKEKWAQNSSEFLTYMGAMDGEKKHLIKRLISFPMKGGKRTKARGIFYETMHLLAKTEDDAIKIATEALENVKPVCEVSRVSRGGTVYDVPKIVSRSRQQTLAVRWIIEAAKNRRKRKTTSVSECLYTEIMDAYRKRGSVRKKKETLHATAAHNRGYAHFRWW